MGTENKIFKMSLDVSNLISNYKKAIQTMSDIGGPTRTITSFENQLKKLEKEFTELQKVGAQGISKDPASVSAYTKAVEKAYRSLSNLGDEISKVGKDTKAFDINAVKNLTKEIDKAKKAASQFQKEFAQALKNQGLSKKTAETIAQEARSEQDLIEKLKEEKALREENLRIAREAQSEKIKQTKESIKRSSTNLVNLNSTDAASLTSTAQTNIQKVLDREWEKYRKKLDAWKMSGQQGVAPDEPLFKTTKDYIQSINKELSDSIRKGEDFNTVWKNIVKEIQKMTGTTSRSSATGITRLNQSEIFGSYAAATARAKRPFDEMAAAQSTSTTATAVKNALNEVNQINSVISQVSSSSSILNNALNNVAIADRNVAEQTARMSAAEAKDAQQKNALTSSTQNLTGAVNNSADSFRKQATAVQQSSRDIKQTEGAISKFAHMIGSMFSIYSIFYSIRSEIRKTYEDIKTLDKSFASIAMVTNKSVQDMWATYDQYSDMASQLGQKTNSVIEASALFYQQGLDTNEALALTTDTMKLATLAGENYKTATEEMTSAIRGFRMEMSEGAHVTDVYSTLAASAAASVNDIAQAMSRTASIANSAGASFENTSAFLTKVIETTQESPENIGTSLKSIIARFTEIKTNVAGTAESEFDDLDVNKVETALKSVGVQLRDVNGEIRDFDKIIVDLGTKWDGLSRNAQRYVATIAAGSRRIKMLPTAFAA